jgi:MFS family permease
MQLLPAGTSDDARIILAARGVRAYGDGFVSVLLPLHLTEMGFSSLRIGILTTATLLGSAALTLLVGHLGHHWRRVDILLRASVLMIATGVSFALLNDFWPLIVVAFAGTLNPSSGDVSVFLPIEQSILPQTTDSSQRTALFARYSLIGSLVAALGALSAGIPAALNHLAGVPLTRGLDVMFLLYGALGIGTMALYRRLSPRIEPEIAADGPALGPSKRAVYRLAALFSLDSFAGGFTLQSVIALWLFLRFDLSVAVAGTIFFWAGLLSAGSQLLAPVLARRIGLVNTMVFTHLPANMFLIATPLMPNLELAIMCLLIRSALAQMDVPARTSYVMAVVTPPERPAAASLTNVPRSLATAISPTIAGSLLNVTAFGWPLLIGGTLKATYDLMLLGMFRNVRPPEEEPVVTGSGEGAVAQKKG